MVVFLSAIVAHIYDKLLSTNSRNLEKKVWVVFLLFLIIKKNNIQITVLKMLTVRYSGHTKYIHTFAENLISK